MSFRTILVTGANKGIGYEAVKYLSQQLPQANILLSSRNVEHGNSAVKKMQASVPGQSFSNVEVIELDITDKASLASAVEHVRSKYGQLDDLVHNSGISNHNGDDLSPVVLDVNVRGAHDTIEAFLPLIPADTGRISLVSSEIGAWYTASLNDAARAKLEDLDHIDWPQIEAWIEDWVGFSQGKPSQVEWTPITSPLTKVYWASKALVTAWARAWAKQHPERKLAIVCPGYCATE
jgi:NAD(P)-dependent dehydrogenase (short-subunit alcohol dehydrogenase family)